MVKQVARDLVELVDTTADMLRALDQETARTKPGSDKWSIQEILGHLLDSAFNNHQRFVRAQQVDRLEFPKYEQDTWIALQGYNDMPWLELIELWRLANRHVARVVERVPAEQLGTMCEIEPYEPATLEFLIEDYLDHHRHHLRQIDRQR
ncbi:MAG: DinB family protein [Acidobacteriota bacterium]